MAGFQMQRLGLMMESSRAIRGRSKGFSTRPGFVALTVSSISFRVSSPKEITRASASRA